MLSKFSKQLKFALKHYNNPQKLGEDSPLASPYLLSHTLPNVSNPITAFERGQALQVEIGKAAEALWGQALPQSRTEMQQALQSVVQQPGTYQYSYIVLEMRSFNRFFRPRRVSDIWEHPDYLPGSKSEHYRDFDKAVEHLGEMLLNRLHPTLRHEPPPAPKQFVGYQTELEQARQSLQLKMTVAVSGPSGVGKTALGATIAVNFSPGPVFWYTFRPGVNDYLGSLLFALGHFLQHQGASTLWRLLLTAGGTLDDYNLALAAIRQDLDRWADHQRPLLCFDELDRLHTLEPEQMQSAHRQILEFLEGLTGLTPRLLIGQRPVLEADTYLNLKGLETGEAKQLLADQGLKLNVADFHQLYQYTQGNPRLMLLCLALHDSGETMSRTLAMLPQTNDIMPLLRRLWDRLQASERRLLQRLSVLQESAPENWANEDEGLPSLTAKNLIWQDRYGGVELHPAFRTAIYQTLSADLRERLHVEAAEMRLLYAQYTTAAYHYYKGNRNAKAIQCWFPYRHQEIQRGQAEVAFSIFNQFSHRGLNKAERQGLDTILAELYQLQGELETGLRHLEANDWRGDSEASAHASTLKAEFLEALGYPDSGLRTYGESIAISTRLLSRLVWLRRQRSMLHLRQKEMSEAKREASLAECQLHNLRGELQEEEGEYQAALRSFEKASTLAQYLADPASIALTERNLANLYGRLQNLPKAQWHADRAIRYYKQIKDYVSIAKMQDNLAYIYIQTRQFQQAIEQATPALQAFKAMKIPYSASVAAANLAEAYFELNKLDKAREYAYEVLQQEERQTYPYALFTLGQIEQAQQTWPAAELHLSESARLAHLNGDLYLEAYALRALGVIYRKQSKHSDAEATLSQALGLFEQLNITDEVQATKQHM